MLTVAQLLRVVSPDDALTQKILPLLTSLKFPATDWHSGSISRTLIEVVAKLYSEFTATRQVITRSRYNSEAQGDWLTALSSSHFSNERLDATPTIFDVTLTAETGAGPYTIGLTDNILVDTFGRTFRNTTAAVVNTTPTTVRYQADLAGVIPLPLVDELSMQTPLAGVNIGTPTLIQAGTAEESDERLRTRNVSRWGTLGYASPTDAYKLWALEAEAAVTRVRVDTDNPGGPGTVWVYIAGLEELVAGEEVTVADYIEGTDGIGRRPIGSNVTVIIATPQDVPVTATVYYDPTYLTVDALVEDALETYFEGLDIGGLNGVVPLAGIYRTVMSVSGVVNMALSVPIADVAVLASKFPRPVLSLTFTPIS